MKSFFHLHDALKDCFCDDYRVLKIACSSTGSGVTFTRLLSSIEKKKTLFPFLSLSAPSQWTGSFKRPIKAKKKATIFQNGLIKGNTVLSKTLATLTAFEISAAPASPRLVFRSCGGLQEFRSAAQSLLSLLNPS